MISEFRSYGSDMTYVNLVFPIEWLIHGIVYLTAWVASAYTTDSLHLKLDWITLGTVKIIIVYNFRAQLQGTGSRTEVLCEKF